MFIYSDQPESWERLIVAGRAVGIEGEADSSLDVRADVDAHTSAEPSFDVLADVGADPCATPIAVPGPRAPSFSPPSSEPFINIFPVD